MIISITLDQFMIILKTTSSKLKVTNLRVYLIFTNIAHTPVKMDRMTSS